MLEASLLKYSLEYPFSDLQRATDGFNQDRLLGSGSFGAVYRGTHKDGTNVAIKVLDAPAQTGFEEEVRVLSKFRHPNLVILMGFARHGAKRMLVYEFLEGGDLYKRLQKSNAKEVAFPSSRRIAVALDAACGLSHLHNSTPKAFHRDIKSMNVLIDRNGTAKMADFGLACLSDRSSYGVKVSQVSGTVGYADPLYISRGIVTEASEVYSFGVVLLELLTARQAAWVEANGGRKHTQTLVSVLNEQGGAAAVLRVLDQNAGWSADIARFAADFAMRCTSSREETRPEFATVVQQLRQLLNEATASGQHDGEEPKRCFSPHGRWNRGLEAEPEERRARQQQQQQQQRLAQYVPRPPSPQSPSVDKDSSQEILWFLEVTGVVGKEAGAVPKEHARLVHQAKPGESECKQSPAIMRIGRLFQQEFFSALLGECAHSISREHFQIFASTAEEQCENHSASNDDSFFNLRLKNLSIGRTLLNGVPMEVHGNEAPLQQGDVISLGPFIASPMGRSCAPWLQLTLRFPSQACCPSPSPALTHEYYLLVHGTGVRQGVTAAMRRLAFPASSSAHGHNSEASTSLVIGRHSNSSFWSDVLEKATFLALSRLHLQVDLVRAQAADAPATVRCLSQTRPITVRRRHGSSEGSVVLSVTDAPAQLWPGDRIEVLEENFHLAFLPAAE